MPVIGGLCTMPGVPPSRQTTRGRPPRRDGKSHGSLAEQQTCNLRLGLSLLRQRGLRLPIAAASSQDGIASTAVKEGGRGPRVEGAGLRSARQGPQDWEDVHEAHFVLHFGQSEGRHSDLVDGAVRRRVSVAAAGRALASRVRAARRRLSRSRPALFPLLSQSFMPRAGRPRSSACSPGA